MPSLKLAIQSTLALNDGHAMPRLGLGVWQIRSGPSCEAAVLAALEAGYRHIDTAAFYGNEESVGAAVRKSGISRDEIFITTKLWNTDHDDPRGALERSLRKLQMEYVDLYLIHYPVPERLRSWRFLEELRATGKARSIGVSNLTIRHLNELLADTRTIPAINQVEFHPYLFQRELLVFCAAKGIAVEAYSPLTQGARLNDRKLNAIAKRYPSAAPRRPDPRPRFTGMFPRRLHKSAAQILIRWALQHGLAVIPKSSNRQRIFENADVFDFEITPEDMRRLDNFNENLRTCWDPNDAP